MISVIIPAYQSADTIASCIGSVLAQTVDIPIEVIVVDDGSSDSTGETCDRMADSDARVVVIHQPNRGRSVARWKGIERATGQWVTFVDSDDTLPPTALADLYEATKDVNENIDPQYPKTVGIVLGNGHTLSDEHRQLIPMNEFRHMAVRADGTIGVPWGSLFRRDLLTEQLFDLPREIYNGEDYIFWLRLVFSTDSPVKVVYKSVYNKGEEHTSNSFRWTADYCYRLNEYRKAAIPDNEHLLYMNDMLNDRIGNLFAATLYQKRSEWTGSPFYAEILADMATTNRQFTLKQRLYLALPSRWLRRLVSYFLSAFNHRS